MTAGIIDIRGKQYQTVAKRVQEFRADHPDWTIHTEIHQRDEAGVFCRAVVSDRDGVTIATGHAEETRTGGVNKTSALENCETSAVGRALAFVGYATDAEIASAEEMAGAVIPEERAIQLRERLHAIEKDEGKFCAYLKIPSLENMPEGLYGKAVASLDHAERVHAANS